MDRTKRHSAVCKAIADYVAYQGGYIVKNLGGLGQRRGRPDFDACVRSKFVAIEVKTGEGVLSRDQQAERERIIAAGGLYIQAETVDDVEEALLAEGLAVRRLLR
jgi:hypothetical protein